MARKKVLEKQKHERVPPLLRVVEELRMDAGPETVFSLLLP